MKCLRRVQGVTRIDRIINREIKEDLQITSIFDFMSRTKVSKLAGTPTKDEQNELKKYRDQRCKQGGEKEDHDNHETRFWGRLLKEETKPGRKHGM